MSLSILSCTFGLNKQKLCKNATIETVALGKDVWLWCGMVWCGVVVVWLETDKPPLECFLLGIHSTLKSEQLGSCPHCVCVCVCVCVCLYIYTHVCCVCGVCCTGLVKFLTFSSALAK